MDTKPSPSTDISTSLDHDEEFQEFDPTHWNDLKDKVPVRADAYRCKSALDLSTEFVERDFVVVARYQDGKALERLLQDQAWLTHLLKPSGGQHAASIFSQSPITNINHLVNFVKLSHCKSVGGAMMRENSPSGVLFNLWILVQSERARQKSEGEFSLSYEEFPDPKKPAEPRTTEEKKGDTHFRERLEYLSRTLLERE
jgi:hypothetical protein